MANKPIKSIKYPGLSDTYTFVQIGTEAGQAADAKMVGDEIEKKVSKPTSSPNGTAGQLLRTNGDGTTQWVDQGLPTDEQTAEAVTSWLDDHPEATTTVQDGSLTYKKLVTGTLGFVTPEMFGAKGDGETDDTAAIQSAINSGTKYVLFNTGKTYVISAGENGVALSLSSNVTLDLNGATLQLSANALNAYSVLSLINISGVTVKNGKIIGDKLTHTGASGEHGNGISISRCSGIRIEHVEVSYCWGDGIYIGSGDIALSNNVLVKSCNVHHNGRNNISVVACTLCKIENCYIGYADRTAPMAGIDVEPNDNDLDYSECWITNCVFEGNLKSILVALYGSIPSKVYASNIRTSEQIQIICTSENHEVVFTDVITTCNTADPFYLSSAGSYINISKTTWFIGDSDFCIVHLVENVENISVDADIFKNGNGDMLNSFYGSGNANRNNVNIACRCHYMSDLRDKISSTKWVENNSIEFDSFAVLTASATLPSKGGAFIIDGLSTATTFPVRTTSAQKGTVYKIWNKSNYGMNFSNIYTVQSGHYAVFKAIDFGTVINIADYIVS